MRRWFEQLEQFAIEVILEDRKGKRAAILRTILYALSYFYRASCNCGSGFTASG